MNDDRRLKGSEARLLRGYGPVACAIAAFLLMATLAPTVAPEALVGTPGGPHRGATAPGPASGSTPPTAPGAPGATTPAGDAALPAGAGEAALPAGAVACDGPQVIGDPYSPPCRQWAGGDNGGETAHGVSADTITVSVRDPGVYDVGAIFQQMTGRSMAGAPVTRDDYYRTIRTMAEYFNTRFQFYGRRIVIKDFIGQGSLFEEILGGGQAAANADGINVAEQIRAFADASLETIPFAEALTSRQVIVTNPIYPPRSWYAERAPYAWGGVTADCTKLLHNLAQFLLGSVVDRPAAYAGGDLQGRPRRLGLVYPETPTYKACGDGLRDALAAGGHAAADVRLYPLSLDGGPPAAQSIASAFANQGITTVVLGSDPLLPYFMTSTAEQNGWHPEWVTGGIGFVDYDFAGQLYEPAQWARSFGTSLRGAEVPAQASLAYAAYRSVDPNTSPDPLVAQVVFYQLYLLAIGIHMAGPTLTPDTFAQGLRGYQSPGVGDQGRWAFPDGDYTAPQDARIVAWDLHAVSRYNDQPGTYRDTGTTYPVGELPENTQPPFP